MGGTLTCLFSGLLPLLGPSMEYGCSASDSSNDDGVLGGKSLSTILPFPLLTLAHGHSLSSGFSSTLNGVIVELEARFIPSFTFCQFCNKSMIVCSDAWFRAFAHSEVVLLPLISHALFVNPGL